MSSGMTKSRPSRAALARPARSRWSVARGEAPSRSSGEARVAATSLMTYCFSGSATCTVRTAAIRSLMSSAWATGSSVSSGEDDPCESSIASSDSALG